MNELSRINPSTAKVTVVRPMGRAASNGGAREVEAVTPVVLDNDAALGFLRERSRQNAAGQGEQRQDQGNWSDNKHSVNNERLRSGSRQSGLMKAAYGDQRFHSQPSLHTSASTGFVTHLIGQSEGAVMNPAETAQKQMLLERFNQSSEAYRRAGAEPVHYGESSQVVRVAV